MVAVLLLLVVGCGGEGDDGDVLAGTSWTLVSGSCYVGPAFNRSGGYLFAVLCSLEDGSLGLQEEIGTYTVRGNLLDTFVTQATCADSSRGGTTTFAVTANTLTFQTPTGILAFTRDVRTSSTPGGPGAVAEFGCYRDGLFYRMPLAPL